MGFSRRGYVCAFGTTMKETHHFFLWTRVFNDIFYLSDKWTKGASSELCTRTQ